MQIKAISGGYVTLQIEVATCLTLADACRRAAETCDGLHTHGQVFDLLNAAFVAYALVGVGHTHMRREDIEEYTPEEIAERWGYLPRIIDGKEVMR